MPTSYPASKKSAATLPGLRLPEPSPSALSNVRMDAPSLLAVRMDTLALQGGRLHSYGLE